MYQLSGQEEEAALTCILEGGFSLHTYRLGNLICALHAYGIIAAL